MRGAGLRLDAIYPADEPHTAVLRSGDRTIRLTCRQNAPRVPHGLPDFQPEFAVTRASGAAARGRAGMLYRDLIPGRLGGRYIASHITIPEAGPVPDWVHFHAIAFQLILVRRGWVRVVYEDQGAPFVMREGDLVLQPPRIRHRVLESSGSLEVVEITCPAMHETFADHELDLPNGSNPVRRFGGQRFVRHVAAEAAWTRFDGGEAQETGIGEATGALAAVRTVRGLGEPISFPPHDGELVFGFVLDGAAVLDSRGAAGLGPADAFVIPPGEAWRLREPSGDFRLLHVTTARIARIAA